MENPPGRKGTWTWDGLKDVIGFHAIHNVIYIELSKRNATQIIDQTISGGISYEKLKALVPTNMLKTPTGECNPMIRSRHRTLSDTASESSIRRRCRRRCPGQCVR
jgi:hypothetical protein